MTNTFIDKSWIEGIEIPSPPQAILKVEEKIEVPRFKPSDENYDYLHTGVNDQLNSRVNGELSPGSWVEIWKSEIEEYLWPKFVLFNGTRILVEGLKKWQLFDAMGTAIKIGSLGSSCIALDPANELFFLMDNLGYLSAWQLKDGRLAYIMKIDFSEYYFRFFMTRHEQSLIVAGIEQELEHDAPPPNTSLLEVLDIGDPPDVADDHILKSFKTRVSLMRKSSNLHVARKDATLVIGTENYIYIGDLNLKLNKVFAGKFSPLAMSLDEEIRIYLIVLKDDNKCALWVLTPEGKQIIDVEIPYNHGYGYIPPCIGFNHIIYVLLENQIMAINFNGEIIWDVHTSGPIAGAVVTASDQLLVSEGNVLMTYEITGERRIVYAFEGETLSTQPILTREGHLIVGSQKHLFCLRKESSE